MRISTGKIHSGERGRNELRSDRRRVRARTLGAVLECLEKRYLLAADIWPGAVPHSCGSPLAIAAAPLIQSEGRLLGTADIAPLQFGPGAPESPFPGWKSRIGLLWRPTARERPAECGWSLD